MSKNNTIRIMIIIYTSLQNYGAELFHKATTNKAYR